MKNPNLVIFSAALIIAILSHSCYGTSRKVSALQFEPNIMPVLHPAVHHKVLPAPTCPMVPGRNITYFGYNLTGLH
jgi:hypothetical protein